MGRAFAWSWSQLENFENCKRRWWLESWAKKVPYVQNEAAKWGDKVHKALEVRIGPQKVPLPSNMAQYEPFAAAVVHAESRGARLVTEQKLGLTSAWGQAGYFGNDTWCRVITDATLEKGDRASVIDWKTNAKPKQGSGQLRLAACAVMAHRPYLKTVDLSFVWVANGAPPTTETVHREELPEIRASFLPRVKAMTDAVNADKFPPQPSGLCGWCSVGKANCEHWVGNNGRG